MTCAHNRLPKRDPRLLLGAIVSAGLLSIVANLPLWRMVKRVAGFILLLAMGAAW